MIKLNLRHNKLIVMTITMSVLLTNTLVVSDVYASQPRSADENLRLNTPDSSINNENVKQETKPTTDTKPTTEPNVKQETKPTTDTKPTTEPKPEPCTKLVYDGVKIIRVPCHVNPTIPKE